MTDTTAKLTKGTFLRIPMDVYKALVREAATKSAERETPVSVPKHIIETLVDRQNAKEK